MGLDRSKRHWDINNWAHAVYSYESIFHTFNYSSSHCIKRLNNERLSTMITKKILMHAYKVHVCGCYSRFLDFDSETDKRK